MDLDNFTHHDDQGKLALTGNSAIVQKVLTSLNYIVAMTVGNALSFCIIHYEKFGCDPKKRSIANYLTSFCLELVIGSLVVVGSLAQWSTLFGPVGPTLAMVSVFTRQVIISAFFLTMTQHVLIKCLMVFQWTMTAGLNDDLIATFLKVANLSLSVLQVLTLWHLGHLNTANYILLSGEALLTNDRYTKWTRATTGGSMFVICSVCVISIRVKKYFINQQENVSNHLPAAQNDQNEPNIYNNVSRNQTILKYSQALLAMAGALLVTAPFLFLKSLTFPILKVYMVAYREMLVMTVLNIAFPVFLIAKNQKLRNYIRSFYS